jgi:membrane fusion protein, adhesin transport system
MTEENKIETSKSTLPTSDSLQNKAVSFLGQGRQKPTPYYAKFLSRATLLEESGPTKGAITTVAIICAFVIIFVIWSFITTLNETSVAIGEIVPADSIQPIQHLEGGIVEQVLVKDGDIVKKGDTILVLDSTSTLSELDRVKARNASVEMQILRLRQFALGEEADFSSYAEEHPEITLDQAKILKQQMDSRIAQENVFISRIANQRNQLKVLEQQEVAQKQEMDIVGEELKIREELTAKGLGSKIRLLEIQRVYTSTQSQYDTTVTQKAGILANIREAEGNLTQLREELNNDALNQIGQMIEEGVQLSAELSRLNDKVSRLKVTSPVEGIVKGLKYRASASVIPPGDIIAEIVPVDKKLVAEVRISPRDIGHVVIGSEVVLKVDTYNYSLFGGIPSTLDQVSASSYLDEQGQAYFKGYINLPNNYVGSDPADNRVTPGMTLVADIKTGEKTLFQYLVKPINNAINTAFRER